MKEFKCIRCKNPYRSKDDDAYLCDSCNQARLALAKEIDAKIGSTEGQQPNGNWAQYMKLVEANGGKWPTASQLGLR